MSGLPSGFDLGGYIIEGELGRGGMGVVYRARQVSLARSVALKVLAPDLAADPTFVLRFSAESRLAAEVEHRNVVPVYEAGEHDGLLFIAMRFVPGIDLRALVHGSSGLEPDRAINLVEQIAAGLDAVHAAGLVHRDVKPANVLVTGPDEQAYLTDFGLARHIAGSSTGLTDSGSVMGTLDYMSPEQFRGGRVDGRSDIYSLGALLFHLVEGHPPYGARDPAAKGYAHVHEVPPPLAVPAPTELNDVIQRAMAKEPAERFASAGDLARAARAAVEGTTIRLRERVVATGEAAPEDPPTASLPNHGENRRRRRTRPLAWAAFGLALLVGAIVAITSSGADSGRRDGVPDLVAMPPHTTPALTAHPTVVQALPPTEAPPAEPAPAPADFTRTATRVYAPFADNSQPAITISGTKRGVCWLGSLVAFLRADAWRCMSGSRLRDPCFAVSSSDREVVCADTPWAPTGVKLELGHALPRNHQNADGGENGPPWGVELADGTRCTSFNGAAPMVADKRLNYFCERSQLQLYGDVDRGPQKWAIYARGNRATALHLVSIRVAWY